MNFLKLIHMTRVRMFIILLLVITYTFRRLPQTFYQQDEWMVLGHNLVDGISNITKYSTPYGLLIGDGRPLGRALNLIFFGLIKFDLRAEAYFAIAMHSVNAYLVYLLTDRLFRKKIAA